MTTRLGRPLVAVASCASSSSAYATEHVERALDAVTDALQWGYDGNHGFGGIVGPDSKVVIKPNWVLDRNRGPWGTEPLVTHHSLVRAVTDRVIQSGASKVTVGDAPLQGCDFDRLLGIGDLRTWESGLRRSSPSFRGIVDFRRTRSREIAGVLVQQEEQVQLDDYLLFDLGTDSLLEPVSSPRGLFRVTQYDPRKLRETHGPGRHQYLIARAVLDADVIVNLPKLKTHKKAGMTCALKNLVGINGNKEFLPHHRVGGVGSGGDCYPGRSRIKMAHEAVLDLQNRLHSHVLRSCVQVVASALSLAGASIVDQLGVEGAWSGNDTVWRMCLDLNRIAVYGTADGRLANTPQRRIITIADAVIAGQGDGPLAPEPVDLGLLLASENSVALDLIGCQLLGYDWRRIPIVESAFRDFRYPLVDFRASAVELAADPRCLSTVRNVASPEFYPAGWLGAVDRSQRQSPAVGRTFSPRRGLTTISGVNSEAASE